MTDGTPGWFRDPSDPALARWHDGEKWTDHTLVIADQKPGEEPPPPVEGDEAGFVPADPDFRAGRPNPLSDLPPWAKIAIPVGAIAIVVLLAVVLLGGGGGKDKTETADTRGASLDDAVDAARSAGLPTDISDARAAALIERICSAARSDKDTTQLAADLAQLPASSVDDVRSNVEDLGKGASVRCPSDMASADDLVDQLQDEAAVAFTTTTTAVTAPTDGGTDAGGATTEGTDNGTTGTTSKSGKKTTSTTKKGGSTSTTAKPTTTTTVKRVVQGQPCSSPGAHAVSQNGSPLTCQKHCYGAGGSTYWLSSSPCETAPTVPATTAPTAPPTTPTTAGGSTGGTGGPTTGG
jgi:hypothetical protein